MNSKTEKYLDLTTYSVATTGVSDTPLATALFVALNGRTGLMEHINTQLNKDVDKFRKDAASLGFELRGLDDGNRAYSVLNSSISQCTSEKNGYNGSQLGLQTIKSKGIVTGVVCGHAKKRNKVKSKTLTKAMMTTATQIVDGRDYGDMMDLLAQFCEYAQITSEDLEILATRVA